MAVTDVALATSIPPVMRRPGPGGEEAGPGWRRLCLASWPAPGWQAVTLNPAEEAESLGSLPDGVGLAVAEPGVAEAYGRPGVWVSDALGRVAATGAPVVGIVNADIRLDLDPRRRGALVERAAGGLVVCNRMDVGHAAQHAGPFYRYGYDLVLMPRDIAARLDLSGFALGMPWWDYWIVLDALLQGIPVTVVQCPGVQHLAHQQAWHRKGWMRALSIMALRMAPRRAALAGLGMGAVAEAAADLLSAMAANPGGGYPLPELTEVAGTRFGIEVVRRAEWNTWWLD